MARKIKRTVAVVVKMKRVVSRIQSLCSWVYRSVTPKVWLVLRVSLIRLPVFVLSVMFNKVCQVAGALKQLLLCVWRPTAKMRAQVGIVLYVLMLWSVACFFYGFEFLHRLIPALIAPELSRDLSLQASQLGSITAYYFYAYALAQLPAGLLIDKYGLRKTLTLASLLVAIGSALLSGANDAVIAAFSRGLIGFGSGFAFAATLKVISVYFHASLFALFVGLTNSVGILVATFGQVPFANFVSEQGWREAMFALAAFGVGVSLLLWLAFQQDAKRALLGVSLVDASADATAPIHDLPDSSDSYDPATIHAESFIDTLIYVVKQPQIWWFSCIAAMRVTPIISFAELWAGPFLSSCYQADRTAITQLVTSIFLGIAAGGPMFGLLSRWFLRRHLIFAGGLCSLVITSVLLTGVAMHPWALTLLLSALGMSSSSLLLCFGLCVERVPVWAQGAAIGFMNMWITLYGAALLPLIGYMLQWQNPGCALDYSLSQYQGALLVVPLSLALSLIMTWALKFSYFNPLVVNSESRSS